MCPSPEALRSLRAHKGWVTRRDGVAELSTSPPRPKVGVRVRREERENQSTSQASVEALLEYCEHRWGPLSPRDQEEVRARAVHRSSEERTDA